MKTKGTYTVIRRCCNCGQNVEMTVPQGKTVAEANLVERTCPNCKCKGFFREPWEP